MDRTLQAAAVLGATALVLALAALAVAVAPAIAVDQVDADPPPPNQTVPIAPADFDSTERLVLFDEDPTTDEAFPSVDPALATSSEFQELTHAWENELFYSELDAESTSEGKVGVLEEDLDDLRQQVIELNHAEQEAHRAFEAGEIDATEFVTRLAVIEQRGGMLHDRLETVRAASRGITSPVVQDNVTSIQANVGWLQLETESFEGPNRNTVWEVIRGERTQDVSITVHATEHGYSISTIDDVMFTREIYFAPNHDRAGGGFLSTEEGGERVATLYPWSYEESFEQDPRARGDIFREILTHPHGTTTTYLSGAAELPYREIHELDLAAVPTVEAFTETGDEYEVTLYRTYAGGPAHVEVTNSSGDPVSDVSVSVDNRVTVETDSDGIAWFTTAGEHVFVSVTVSDERLTMRVPLPIGEAASE